MANLISLKSYHASAHCMVRSQLSNCGAFNISSHFRFLLTYLLKWKFNAVPESRYQPGTLFLERVMLPIIIQKRPITEKSHQRFPVRRMTNVIIPYAVYTRTGSDVCSANLKV